MIDRARTLQILWDLIALPSVNPMGRPHAGIVPIEKQVLDYLEALFQPFDVELLRVPCSPIHESLLVRIPGASDGPATLLESHADTVPADDWLDTAFTPRLVGDTLYGRGACDDKGCLAAMTLAALDILESGIRPPQPVWFLAAGDEEFHQTGIKNFASTQPSLARAIIGEPTQMRPVLQHKGVIRWDIVVHGRSAHSAQPELGIDAIHGGLLVCQSLRSHQEFLRAHHSSTRMTGPSLSVTTLHGGRTRNAIADECVLSVDFRVNPGMDPATERQALIDTLIAIASDPASSLGKLGVRLEHRPPQTCAPPLSTSAEHPFSQRVLELCRRANQSPELDFSTAPYCTDAGWIAHACPALVLGPGSIAHAHAIDECIDLNEVQRCAILYRDIVSDNPIPTHCDP